MSSTRMVLQNADRRAMTGHEPAMIEAPQGSSCGAGMRSSLVDAR
jgi:hypothetical protein